MDEQEKVAFMGFAGHLMKRLLLHHGRPLYRCLEKMEFQEEGKSADATTESLAEVEKRFRGWEGRYRSKIQDRGRDADV